MSDFETHEKRVKEDIKNNRVVLYMRGTPEAPRCGFSARTVGVFEQLGVDYHTVDLDADRSLWQALAKINDWPTSPQIFVNGEFVGGCDNVIEMWEAGELQKMLQQS